MNKERIEAFQKYAVEIYHFLYKRIQVAYDARGCNFLFPSHIAINENGDISLIDMSEQSQDTLDYEDIFSSEENFLAKYAAIKTEREKEHAQRYVERMEREKAEELEILKKLYEKHKDKIDWQ